LDQQKIDARLECNRSETSATGSIGAIWNFSQDANLLFSFNRSQRAPSIEELYSNIAVTTCNPSLVSPNPESYVQHAATGRFEFGEPDLKKETATNLEIAYRKYSGKTKAEISVFINSIQDYIYLADVSAYQDSIISRYLQEDARFVGVETSYDRPLKRWSDEHFVNLNLFADYVEAELATGHYLPRIPPLRAGFEIEYAQQDWRMKLRNTFVQSQDKNSLTESSTENYQRLDLFADYHLHFDDKELLLFAKGKNLLNEDIRNHTSFLKAFAPEAGRSLELGVRYTY
jgi:iron complex outermembrane receptor protein